METGIRNQECRNNIHQKGQSLFEVVVALAISTLIIIAIVTLATNSIKNATYSKNQSRAANYATETTEWLRNRRDSDIGTFMTNTKTPIWCISSLSFNTPGTCVTGNTIPDTSFYRQVAFSSTLTPDNKTIIEADVKIYWTDSQGYHEIVNATNYTDWRQR